jgi:hypothetical protein
MIASVTPPRLSEKIIHWALTQDGMLLRHIPETKRLFNHYKKAVCQNGLALQYIKTKDIRICILAIQQNPMALEFVDKSIPEYNRICLTAVYKNGYALQFIDAADISEDLCKAAIQSGFVTSELVLSNPANYFVCLQMWGRLLEFIPKHQQTEELCLAAIHQNGDALEYVNEDLKTPHMCLEAIRSNQERGEALDFVPKKYLTPEFCEAAGIKKIVPFDSFDLIQTIKDTW